MPRDGEGSELSADTLNRIAAAMEVASPTDNQPYQFYAAWAMQYRQGGNAKLANYYWSKIEHLRP